MELTGVELAIRMAEGAFSGVFLPLQRSPNTVRVEDYAKLAFDALGGVKVKIPRKENGSRAAYAWYDRKLVQLF